MVFILFEFLSDYEFLLKVDKNIHESTKLKEFFYICNRRTEELIIY